MSKKSSLPQTFKFALNGVREALGSEPNFKIHLWIASFVLLAAFFVGFNIYEWLLLLFTISFVLILELFNTSLEALVDLVSPEVREKAKVAKDVSAAAVLLAAIMSIIVGLALFLSKFQQL